MRAFRLFAAAIRASQLVAPFEPLEMVRGTAWYLVYPRRQRAEPSFAIGC